MSDEVKAIFKSLIKVPCMVVVIYMIFNLLVFSFMYFKVMGTSYVIMQTAVENNYIPQTEFTTLCKYMNQFYRTPFVSDVRFIYGPNKDGNGNYTDVVSFAALDNNGAAKANGLAESRFANHGGVSNVGAFDRKQYGSEVFCGIQVDYIIQWPLDYRETTVNETGVQGMRDNVTTQFESESNLEQKRNDSEHRVTIPIVITYNVPGLRYYADMR